MNSFGEEFNDRVENENCMLWQMMPDSQVISITVNYDQILRSMSFEMSDGSIVDFGQSNSDFDQEEVTFQPYQRLIGFTALVNEED